MRKGAYTIVKVDGVLCFPLSEAANYLGVSYQAMRDRAKKAGVLLEQPRENELNKELSRRKRIRKHYFVPIQYVMPRVIGRVIG